MAEKPEVIQHELEETRHALAEKLEQIGEKISGTVETVSDTVSNVTEAMEGTVQAVAESVSGTVESVKETMEAMGETASDTVEAVKDAFNVPEQVRRHPWAWVGGSVVAGFVAGKIFEPRPHHTPAAHTFTHGNGYHAEPQETQTAQLGRDTGREHDHEETSTGSGMASVLGGLAQQFAPELDKLKGLALGTLFGVVRDMVSQSVPESLKDQIQGVFNDFTQKVGGKPIQGSVLAESQQDGDQHAESTTGGEHGERNPTEMDRSLGTAERKSKAAVGKSNRR